MSEASGQATRQTSLFTVEHDDGPFAGVVLNRPVDGVFTYRIPARLKDRVAPGCRVLIPLGRGNEPTIGYCVSVEPTATADLDRNRIKNLLELLDDPPLLDDSMLGLTRWLAGYYACSWGQALDAVVPSGVKKAAGTRIATCLLIPEEHRDTPEPPGLGAKQREVLELIRRSAEPLTAADVSRMARCGIGTIASLRKRGLLHTVKRRMDRPVTPPEESAPASSASTNATALQLTEEQRVALAAMAPALERAGTPEGFAAFLLHGVTGSGKTEVYLSAIEAVAARDREAIVLVPEISLTPQTIRRFRRRFPKIAVLHSHLSDAQRHHHWKAIAAGEVQVVVGARSAVFAPTRRLGLIVIDEEHEGTFKQETIPRYHARDVAVKRAQMLGVPIILGSATPALETWRNAETGRYTRLTLSRRVAGRPMPPVDVIDLRHEKPSEGNPVGGLSAPLRTAMREAIDADGQVILLLNRRGFHTFILCPRCGNVITCHACDVALTHHKGRRRAMCHTCDAEREPPASCPNCHAAPLFYGGIGTERLEREVRAAFPEVAISRMDSDTMRSSGSHERVLRAFKDGEIRILLGTQMIAKGLDFPNVTLVGVVSADTALHLPDFRAAERTFQLVAQVAGRTGRGDRPGRVLVQTYAPDDPSIVHASRHDYLGFVRGEMDERQRRGVPPFGRLARLIARGPDEAAVLNFLQAVAGIMAAQAPEGVRRLGPAPAPVSKIKNLFRFHLRLVAPAAKPLQTLLHAVLPRITPPPGIELVVDVDPVNML